MSGRPPAPDDDLWDAPDLVPSIGYVDVPRAVEWLGRVFGFRERSEARLSWPGGARTWIEIGDSLLSIASVEASWLQAPGPAGSSVAMKVYVDDLDGHFARARAEGATIVCEPEDGFWGGRIYRALDIEGHRWEIAQRGRDLAAERWRLPARVRRGVET